MARITFETYPDVFNPDGTENVNYDNQLRIFSVLVDWCLKWIKDSGYADLQDFEDNYTWDDTLQMYNDAYSSGNLVEEHIEETYPVDPRFPASYAEIEYRDMDSEEAVIGAHFDDMNFLRYFER